MIITGWTGDAPRLSVIIANWNGARFLPRCLDSLRAQTLEGVQVILADNASTDDSVALCKRAYPEVRVVRFDRNLGFAEANNRAVGHADAPYLLFLNNDTHLDPDALRILVDRAEAQPEDGILAPQQRTYDGEGYLNMGMSVDILGWPCVGNAPRDKVFYADGACLFVRRAVFAALGGFDATYFMFFEDADLCWRAWLGGYSVAQVPEAVVYHLAGGTAGSSLVTEGARYSTTRVKRRLTHRNQLATIIKNYSAPALLLVVPLFVVLTLGEVVLLVVSGQRAAVRDAYLPAWGDLVRQRRHLYAARCTVQGSRRVGDAVIVRRMEWRIAAISRFLASGMPAVGPS